MTRNDARISGWSIVAVGMLLLGSLSLAAQDDSSPKPTFNHPQYFGVSAPVRELAKLPQPVEYTFREVNPIPRIAKPNSGHVVDIAEHGPAFPVEFAIALNFPGVGKFFPGFTIPPVPPDANMAVGDTQIVQWVNTSFAVFDKATGAALTPAIPGNVLWNGLGGSLCSTHNSGDPIAQYDRAAHVWLLAQNVLTSPYAVCVAVSTTPDATGTYYVYQFPVPGNRYPDYPKWGIWSSGGASDGYYQTMKPSLPSGGWQVCGYDRMKLLVGNATAEQICFLLPPTENNLLPADVDSPDSPPPSQDEFFIGTLRPPTQLSLYSMHITTWSPPVASMTGFPPSLQLLTVNPYTGSCSGAFGGNCVPQKSVPDQLESRGDRLMYRFAYWSGSPGTGSDQHWLVNGDVLSPSGQIGVRWYEFAYSGGVVTAAQLAATLPVQQQTYAGSPTADMNYRWMGSIARDKKGNILLGYNESSSSMYPAIELAGRMALDTSNQLSDELLVIAGTGSQISANKWGQYSSMRIDPVDNCTFWYTAEYYTTTASFDWSTQIVSAKFPNCP